MTLHETGKASSAWPAADLVKPQNATLKCEESWVKFWLVVIF